MKPGREFVDDKKKHRPRNSGRKAEKKIKGDKTSGNAKAFAVQHTIKASRMVQRTLDHQTKRHHLVKSRFTSDIPPPYVVAIVGPPQCGKSTLLRSLIKFYARQSISVVKGPITVVIGKSTRFTFIECGCDINSMLDAAKIADVVLLLVNVRVGLEMYHFEFINMMQVHGMPRVIPVLNHLDTFKDSSSSRAMRRKIKQRLWTDINAKIFLLSKFQSKKYKTETSASQAEPTIQGDYLLAEVRRLARMLMVKTPRPSDWRASHPYLLIDRIEDITDDKLLANSQDVDRCISLYGWVRGAPLPPALTSPGIHIAGLGDFALADCTRQPDPCPLPSQISDISALENGKPSRHLSERDRKIYAPMSSLGGVLFDRDATYIDLGGSHYLTSHKSRTRDALLNKGASQAALDQVHATFSEMGGLDEQLEKEHRVRMIRDAPLLLSENVQDDSVSDSESDESDASDVASDEDVDMENEDDKHEEDVQIFAGEPLAGFLIPAGTQYSEPQIKSKEDLAKPKGAHLAVKKMLDGIDWKVTSASRINWNRLVYNDIEGLTPGDKTSLNSFTNDHDFTLRLPSNPDSFDWDEETLQSRLANRFTTGQWNANEDAQTLLRTDTQARSELELLEARKHALASSGHVEYKAGTSSKLLNDYESEGFGDDDSVDDYDDDDMDVDDVGRPKDDNIFHDSSDDSDSDSAGEGDAEKSETVDPTDEFEKRLLRPTKRQKILEKRQRHKALFDQLYQEVGGGSEASAFYDKQVAAREAQQAMNRKVLKSLPEEVVDQLDGFVPGAYVRLVIQNVPYQFIERFDPCQPLVAGGLTSTEESFGHLLVRFRTHRWLKRILRSNDPLTVSIGWRRYQTVCVFSKEEHNLRKRYLKYSLPHEHCLATIYGPLVPPKTGVCAFVNSAWRPPADSESTLPSFRVAGTGSILDSNKSFQIMKKLKLIGEPYKIFSKTAFIRGMFNSELEVSKMIGARIQTVSKIRGLIKAALTNPSTSKPGDFRATFEAQIRKADLVFLRSFVAVDLPTYYNPVLNRLCPIEGEDQSGKGWRLLRTLGELRREKGIKPDSQPDSYYKPIDRPVFVSAPLRVPTKLVAQLPFAHKPKPSRKEALAISGGDTIKAGLFAEVPPPVRTAEEMQSESRRDLLHRLRYLHSEFLQRQREKMVQRVSKFKDKCAKQGEINAANERRKRKQFFARGGGKGKEGARPRSKSAG